MRDAEHRGDAAKRELLTALRAAFVTPLEPEDVFALSRGIDRLLNHARELINESEAMACPPDARIAEMASLLAGALRHIDTAIASLGSDADAATEAADAAITLERRLEHAYYEGMADLLEVEDRNERIARRELYRQLLAARRDRRRRRRARRLRRHEGELTAGKRCCPFAAQQRRRSACHAARASAMRFKPRGTWP